jgi:hypothetical protein
VIPSLYPVLVEHDVVDGVVEHGVVIELRVFVEPVTSFSRKAP